MSWWGKVLGGTVGFMLGGPLGAVLGAVVGHSLDAGSRSKRIPWQRGFGPGDQERVQAAFFTATFSVMGHLAKADGRVSEEEIRTARELMYRMGLDEDQRLAAMRLFNEGKQADFPVGEVLEQLRIECHRRLNLLQMFLEMQLGISLADGELAAAERARLLDIAEYLGFSRHQFNQLLSMVTAQQQFSEEQKHGGQRETRSSGSTLANAYQVLGVEKSASDGEIKKAYRRLISQHHPDKLVAKGLPEEMMKLANEKTQEIKSAYELIRRARKAH